MLFERYANPFVLLDEYVSSGALCEFVVKFIDDYNERKLYEVWLNKMIDKSFDEFKAEVEGYVDPKQVTEEELETTISNSKEILSNFVPNN